MLSLFLRPAFQPLTVQYTGPRVWNLQVRDMSKYLSKSAKKRIPLNAKFAGKGFYKGKGGTKEGTNSGRAGRFVLDRERMLELVVPDLTGFKVWTRKCYHS